MFRLFVISVAGFVLCSPGTPLAADADSTFVWPLKLDLQLASGFGDLRSGRFHAGVDIRTEQTEGKQVYAPEDGYIWRIKTSYTGYGKGLYLKGNSGRIYVFGHLQKYDGVIADYVLKNQIESQRYYLDISPQKNELPVKRGQPIAKTGQSGAWGSPHLHFEVRDSADQPTNPLLYDIKLKDTIAPTVNAVWLEYTDNSSLFGASRTMELDEGRSSLSHDTIVIQGSFGVKAAISDRIGAGSFLLPPERIRLLIDGRLYHEVDYSTFSLEQNLYSLLDRDHFIGGERYKNVYNLYIKHGNRFSNYKSDIPGDGTFSDSLNGFHTIVIEAADAAGNVGRKSLIVYYHAHGDILAGLDKVTVTDTLLGLPLRDSAANNDFNAVNVFGMHPNSHIELIPVRFEADNSMIKLHGNFKNIPSVRVEFLAHGLVIQDYYISLLPEPPAESVTVDSLTFKIVGNALLCEAVLSRGTENHLSIAFDKQSLDQYHDSCDMKKIDDRHFVLLYRPDNSAASQDIIDAALVGSAALAPGVPDTLNARFCAGGKCGMFPLSKEWYLNNSPFFDDAWIAFPARPAVKPPHTGAILTDPLVVDFGDAPLSGSAGLNLQWPLGHVRIADAGLYRWEHDHWRWVASAVEPKVFSDGIYSVLSDTVGPVITKLNIAEGARFKSNTPEIRFTVEDELSGIENDQNFEITIDGKWIIPEFIPEIGQFSGRPYWKLAAGNHTLKIDVHDRCGNHTVVTRHFKIGAAAPKR